MLRSSSPVPVPPTPELPTEPPIYLPFIAHAPSSVPTAPYSLNDSPPVLPVMSIPSINLNASSPDIYVSTTFTSQISSIPSAESTTSTNNCPVRNIIRLAGLPEDSPSENIVLNERLDRLYTRSQRQELLAINNYHHQVSAILVRRNLFQSSGPYALFCRGEKVEEASLLLESSEDDSDQL